MTTPVPDLFDWTQLVVNVRDPEAMRFIERLVQMQRQNLDSQMALLDELGRQLEERRQQLEKGQGGG